MDSNNRMTTTSFIDDHDAGFEWPLGAITYRGAKVRASWNSSERVKIVDDGASDIRLSGVITVLSRHTNLLSIDLTEWKRTSATISGFRFSTICFCVLCCISVLIIYRMYGFNWTS